MAKALTLPAAPAPRWVELQLGDGWVVAFRLALERTGVAVIAEVRIYPLERPGTPGAWSGDGAAIPPGGVTARLLQRVRVGAPLQGVPGFRAWRAAERSIRRDAAPAPPEDMVRTWREAQAMRQAAPRRAPTGSPARVGRRPKPDLDVLPAAAAYADATRRGERQPVQAAARALGLPGDRVRALIHEARVRGLLELTRQGIPGGGLTPRGRALLASQRARSRPTKVRRPRR